LREFRTQTATVRRQLEQEEEIILTANGRPLALMTAVDPAYLEEDLLAIPGPERAWRSTGSALRPGKPAPRTCPWTS